MRYLSYVTVFLLIACGSTKLFAENNKASIPTSAKECLVQGGVWLKAGMSGQEICDMPTKDAGKTCHDSSECQSICVAPNELPEQAFGSKAVGSCYKSTLLLGTCLARVTKGRTEPALCID